MRKYTYFEQDGNTYSLKSQTGLSIGLAAIFVIIGISIIASGSWKGFGYFLIAFSALIVYSQGKRKFIIDADKKVFIVKHNAFQPEVTYPFETFDGITLHRLRYMGLLTINVSAVAYFIVDGKEKTGSLNTALTKGPIQKLIHEIDDILEQYHVVGNSHNSVNPQF